MAKDTPTVTVKALQLHTYHRHSYDVGDEYECDEGDVETVEVQGKAKRVKKGAYKTTAVDDTKRTTALEAGAKAKPTTRKT